MSVLKSLPKGDSGAVIHLPADLLIPDGVIDGVSSVNKFGRNPLVTTTSDPEDIWDGGGLYAPPTAPRLHNIASASAQDAGTVLSSGTITEASKTKLIDSSATFITDGVAEHDIILNDDTQDHSLVESVDSETQLTIHKLHHNTVNNVGNSYRVVTPAGTGAAVVHIKQGLLDGYVEATEFIVLNGTSNVSTVNEYMRINRFHIHGAGSGKTNAGDITATAVTDATVTAKISAGMGQSLMAFFTIPEGKSGYITSIYASLNRGGKTTSNANMALYQRLWADASNGGGDGELVFGFFGITDTSPFNRQYSPYMYVSEHSDVWLRVEEVDGDSDISAGFDIILVDK